ncbi:MAG: beta-galactosidase trimerization domain-containing protein [Coriobacteriia bacterium]
MPTRRGSQDRRATRQAVPAEAKAKSTKKAAPRVTAEIAQDVAPVPQGKAPRRNALFPVGVNCYPLDGETESWDDWYTRDIGPDLDALAEARVALVRLFLSWKVLEPQVGQYDEDAVERFGEILEAVREHKMQAIVCFFADDHLAEMLDVPWGKRRDPRTDSYLIQREVALVQKIVNRFRSDSSIFAWDIANESFFSGFETAAALESWTAEIRAAIREVDPERPITMSADPETLFRHAGVDPRNAIDECEFAVSHATAPYRAYAAEGPITVGPSTYLDSFLLRSAARDLPVLMDDIGIFSLDFSAAEEAAYLRTALYSGFMNRAAGVVLRRYRDMDTERREPYFRDPFEVLVGIADTSGHPKPAFDEVHNFIKMAARIDLRRYSLPPERTAVLIPQERYEPLPNLAGLYDPRSCLQAYVGAKQAQIPVTVARESDELGAYSVVIIPSAFRLLDSTWERLAEFVQGGGTVVLSYGGGDAHPAILEIFGIEFLGDGGGRESMSCRVAQSDVLGALRSFDAQLDIPNFALLGQGGATVIATDSKGSPLLTLNQSGQGRAIYIAAPVERAIAQADPYATPPAVAAMVRMVYGAAARASGCGASVECDSPDVEVAVFQGEQDDVLMLLNHSNDKLTAGLSLERTVGSIADVRGGTPAVVGGATFGVPLEPNGVAALRLTYR